MFARLFEKASAEFLSETAKKFGERPFTFSCDCKEACRFKPKETASKEDVLKALDHHYKARL